ncbi:acyl-CoA thioesterase [Paludibaculum fermentans]|uniref:Acyl-CoA thioesterase n=1 Tax=Paludibaculum fermentans TaxID=1473598 RepID=A0A7S7NXS6_PALFE|nr:thioesterase family protein [Paludibaculum fermentans]QOY91139.1 acyl-CoA thioesterase [Paludibaculum fermentans]
MSTRAPFAWRSRIRFVDTDASCRIHYSALFRHLETAEDEFMRSLGFAYSERAPAHLSYPRVHVEADYLAALRYDDPIYITVGVSKLGTSSYTLEFNVYLEETSEVAASGIVTVVCMSTKTQKACPLPEDLREALSGQRT